MQIHNMSWFFPSHHLSFWQQNVARYYFHKILKSIQRNVDFGLRCTFVQRMCQCQRSAILLLISRNSIHYFALFSTFLEHCQLQSFLAAHFYSASHGIIDCWKKDPHSLWGAVSAIISRPAPNCKCMQRKLFGSSPIYKSYRLGHQFLGGEKLQEFDISALFTNFQPIFLNHSSAENEKKWVENTSSRLKRIFWITKPV